MGTLTASIAKIKNMLSAYLKKTDAVKKAPNGGVKISDNISIDRVNNGSSMEITSTGSEIILTGNGYDLFINKRQPSVADYIPNKFYFCNGSSTSRAAIHCGEMNCTGIKINGTDVTAAILALVSGTNAASEEEE